MDINPTKNKSIVILDLRDSPWVDGPGRTILDCASSLEGKKYHFIIGTFSGGEQKTNSYSDEAKRRKLQLFKIRENSAFDINVGRQIIKVIKENDVNIIHTHDFRSNIFGLICGKLCRKPVITTVHGWIANDVKGKLYILIDKLLLRFFDNVISVSNKTAELIKKSYISDKKLTVINNALKVENYKLDKDFCEIRTEFGIDKEEILIANIGRLSPEKGQLDFLRLAKKIIEFNDKVKFILIGIGPDQNILESYVEKNNIKESVIFAGFRNNMNDIYNEIDLVIQSSYTEGMPNVILEALLMETPVIASDVGGTSEIIKDKVNGVLFEKGRIDQLVIEVNRFLKNTEHFKILAKEGRKNILQNFSHSKRIKQLDQLYDKYSKI